MTFGCPLKSNNCAISTLDSHLAACKLEITITRFVFTVIVWCYLLIHIYPNEIVNLVSS